MRGKERFAPVLLAGMLAFGACKSTDVGQQTPTPTRIEQTNPAESAWRNLPPQERINRIELGTIPSFPNFRELNEFIQATSEFYCEKIPCIVNAKDLESKVLLLDSNSFRQEVEKYGAEQSDARLEAIPNLIFDQNRDDRKILVDIEGLMTHAEIWRTKVPEIEEMINNHSLYYVLLRQVLFHAYSHINQSTEKIQSKDVPFLTLPLSGFTLKTISNLAILNVSEEDGREYEFTQTMEAMTEYVGMVLNNYYFDTPINLSAYKAGAEILARLNKKAGINSSEFLQYHQGKKPFLEYIEKLGSLKNGQSDMQSGFDIYFLIGVASNENRQEVITLIEQVIGQELSK